MSAAACNGEDVPGRVKGARVHARVLVGAAKRGAPQAARGAVRGAGLEVVGVVEWAGTGEQDGGTARVEHGVRNWEGRYMQRLGVWVGQTIDLADAK